MAWGNISAAWDHNGTNVGGIVSLPIYVNSTASTSSTRIYKGSLIHLATEGYAELGGNVAAGDTFAGVAAEDCTWLATDSNGGAGAGIYVKVWTKGEFDLYHASAAITDVGALFEIADGTATYGPVAVTDQADGDTTQYCVGVCVGYGTNRVRIKIDGCALTPAGIAAADFIA